MVGFLQTASYRYKHMHLAYPRLMPFNNLVLNGIVEWQVTVLIMVTKHSLIDCWCMTWMNYEADAHLELLVSLLNKIVVLS